MYYCGILILNRKGNTTKQQGNIDTSVKKVSEVKDIHRVYNIEKYINEMIEYVYDNEIFSEESYYLPYDIIKKIELQKSCKSFYIKRAYEAELEDDIIVYFVKGYTVYEKAEEIQKNDISLMYISDNEYNTGRLYLYGEVYKDMFNYNDDISKTEIIKTKGLKIEKSDSKVMSRDQITIEDAYFQNKNVNAHISEGSLVARYLKEYKITQASENKEKLEENLSFSYEGSFDDGYTIKDDNGKEYYIKPSETPMEYEVTEK